MTEPEDLRNCAHCDGSPEPIKVNRAFGNYIRCKECGVTTPDCRDFSEAVKKWNTRYDDFSSNLQWEAEMRGIKLWQAEAPGRELTWPDKGHLVQWLLGRIDALQSAVERARAGALKSSRRDTVLALEGAPMAPGPTHKHIKRGSSYQLLWPSAGLQCAGSISEPCIMAVYQGTDGQVWVRPLAEFLDGRFEELKEGGE